MDVLKRHNAAETAAKRDEMRFETCCIGLISKTVLLVELREYPLVADRNLSRKS
jgi:hypothetical protein